MGRYTRRHARKLENVALIAQALGGLGQLPMTLLRNKQHDEAQKSLDNYRRAQIDQTGKYHQGLLDQHASDSLLRAGEQAASLKSQEGRAKERNATDLAIAKAKADQHDSDQAAADKRAAASLGEKATHNRAMESAAQQRASGGAGNARALGAAGMKSFNAGQEPDDDAADTKMKGRMTELDTMMRAPRPKDPVEGIGYDASIKTAGSEMARLSEALGYSKQQKRRAAAPAGSAGASPPPAPSDDSGQAMPKPSINWRDTEGGSAPAPNEPTLHDASPDEINRLRQSVQQHAPPGDVGLPQEGALTPPVGSPQHDQQQGQQMMDDFRTLQGSGDPNARMQAWLRMWQRYPGVGRPPRDVLAAAGMGESGQMAFNIAGMGASVLPGPLQPAAQMLGTSALTPHLAQIMAQLGLGFPGAAANPNPVPGPLYQKVNLGGQE